MSITVRKPSREILQRIIRKEFHAIPDEPWADEELYKLIEAARDFGFKSLSEELIENLNHEYQKTEIRKRIKDQQFLISA